MKRILEIARGNAAHIHIPVGKILMTMAIASMSLAVALGAELPAGHTSSWTIEHLVWNATATSTFSLTDCTGFGPLPTFTLRPGGVVRSEAFTCFDGLGVIEAPAGTQSASHMIFDDGTNHASYFVPSLDRKTSSTVAPIAVDMNTGTYVNVYCDQTTTITYTVYDASGAEATTGYYSAPAGWSQYSIGVPVRAGSLKLDAGCVGFGPCPSHPFLGFVSVTDVHGGNAIVLPLK
jgi:hypothetical protein